MTIRIAISFPVYLILNSIFMKYHLIGVEGISMQGVKILLEEKGHIVTGSDLKTTGHDADNVHDDVDVVVRTSAVHPDSLGWVEVEFAKNKKIKVIKRSELLGELTADKILITISGMHGKTTTTSLAGLTLIEAGLDPTVLVGEKVAEFDDKVLKVGKSDYFVMESCEYDKSFLDFKSDIAIITNLDLEHLDTFEGGMQEIIETFKKFVRLIKSNGKLILFDDDKNLKEVASAAREDVEVIYYQPHELCEDSKLIGEHNRANIGAVLALSQVLNIEKEVVCTVAKKYIGPKRRLERIGEKNSAIVYDDYAHHPTEIKTTLSTLKKEFPDRKIVVVFWPHQYNRTRSLKNEFATAFTDADEVVLKPIYFVAGRDNKEGISSEILSTMINKSGITAKVINEDAEIVKYLSSKSREKSLIVTMGAPPIDKVAKDFIKR